jgi:hypothetical protein
MDVKIRRRHHANHTYQYVDIVESVRIDCEVVHRGLASSDNARIGASRPSSTPGRNRLSS